MRTVICSTEATPRICIEVDSCEVQVSHNTIWVTMTDRALQDLARALAVKRADIEAKVKD